MAEDLEAFTIGRRRVDEQQVLANRAGNELRILRHEPDTLAQLVEIDARGRVTVVQDVA